MLGAGFIGIASRRRTGAGGAAALFSVELTGLTDGDAQNGETISFTVIGASAQSQRWQTSIAGGVWMDIPTATGPSETIDITGGRHIDEALIRVGVSANGDEVFSNPTRVRYAAPALGQALADQTFSEDTGVQLYDASVGFTGDNLTYQIDPLSGVTIHPATGLVSFDTGLMALQLDTVLSVSVTNSGGSVSAPVRVTLLEVGNFALENIANEPVISLESGAVVVTVDGGAFAGTYTTDHSGVPLTVANLQSAPRCLVPPMISGTVAVGNDLIIAPGLWLYEGADLGDQRWQHKRDGVDVPGGTDLTYSILASDAGASFSVTETYGAATVSSASVAL